MEGVVGSLLCWITMVVRNDLIEATKGMTNMEKTYWFSKNLLFVRNSEVKPGDFVRRFPNSLDHAYLPVLKVVRMNVWSYDSYRDLVLVDKMWDVGNRFFRLEQ